MLWHPIPIPAEPIEQDGEAEEPPSRTLSAYRAGDDGGQSYVSVAADDNDAVIEGDTIASPLSQRIERAPTSTMVQSHCQSNKTYGNTHIGETRIGGNGGNAGNVGICGQLKFLMHWIIDEHVGCIDGTWSTVVSIGWGSPGANVVCV